MGMHNRFKEKIKLWLSLLFVCRISVNIPTLKSLKENNVMTFKVKHINFQNSYLKLITEQDPTHPWLRCDTSHDRQNYVNWKIYQFHGTCGKTCRTHKRKVWEEVKLKLHQAAAAAPQLLYFTETWNVFYLTLLSVAKVTQRGWHMN